MSRIGKAPILIPAGVEMHPEGRVVKINGAKGVLELHLMPSVEVSQEDGHIIVKRKGNEKEDRAAHGLTRALLNNMVIGVSKGFEKRLEILGVGYRATASGKKMTLNLGFSHPIEFNALPGVTLEMDKENKNIIVISGIDKQKVGETAALIRKYRPPEPYKGEGLRYAGEQVKRKAGKAAVKGGTK